MTLASIKNNRVRAVLAALVLILTLSATAAAASEKVLYRFHGADGNVPNSVILGSDGALYGVTVAGGTNSCGGQGCGVVFQLTPGGGGLWHEKVLHDFAGSDGWVPSGSLVADKAGNLYGTTVYGGPNGCSGLGCGVAYELKRGGGGKWTYSILHLFFQQATDGGQPSAGMTFDLQGNLYGTTSIGGNTSGCTPPAGCGVVFKLAESKGTWTETVLYSFGGNDGAFPYAPLTLEGGGGLYGTTEWGGAYDAGTVFKLSPEKDGQWSENVLHSFSSETKDGGQPIFGVIFDKSGDIYGTTPFGGAVGQQGWGTAFKLAPEAGGKWKETILRTFDEHKLEGGAVSSGLVLDEVGNLYGTAAGGGRYTCPVGGSVACGVAFRLTPQSNGKWTETVLHSFGKGKDGAGPGGDLARDPAGHMFGVTGAGGYTGGPCGKDGCGVVFEIMP